MNTTTWSTPDEAGSGSATNEDVMRGASGPVGRQPSAMAPAALAAFVRKVRRFMVSRLNLYRFAVMSKKGRFVAVVDVIVMSPLAPTVYSLPPRKLTASLRNLVAVESL